MSSASILLVMARALRLCANAYNVTNLTDEFYTASCASAYACWVGSERQARLSVDYRW